MKKKGSAMVFTVLILGFFLAIALNVMFLSQRKGERAVQSIEGERVGSSIELASTLGYYELYLADQYVTKGFLYRNNPATGSDNGDYIGSSLSSGNVYIHDPQESTDKKFTGINFSRYLDYFSSSWLGSQGSPQIDPKIRSDIEINLAKKKVKIREWDQKNENLKKLWLEEEDFSTLGSKAFSLGGYKIYSMSISKLDGNNLEQLYPSSPSGLLKNNFKETVKAGIEDVTGASGDLLILEVLLEKEVYISEPDIGADPYRFRIKAKNRVVLDAINYDTSSDPDIGFDKMMSTTAEDIEEIVVERLY